MDDEKSYVSLASNERIENLIEEAKSELVKIHPEIEYLENCNKKLTKLKEQQFKLNSLIISLKSLLKTNDVKNNTFNHEDLSNINNINSLIQINANDSSVNDKNMRKIFLPDQAISQVKNYLRTKNNLNYEIYKAVVFNSGISSTEEIKEYLIENKIRQPKTGKSFEKVELKEISSRTNYLVRKQILITDTPGHFRSVFGWQNIEYSEI